jgi:hypothetical protein
MNIQALLVVLVLGGGMIAAGAFLVKGQIDQRVEAETELVAQETRAELAERQLERMTNQLAQERTRQEELVRDLQAARDREATTTEVVEDRDRLNRLTQAKPGLIERQARKATTKVWNDIEADSRE